MAKNKTQEQIYKSIGRERARLRRQARTKQHRSNVRDRGTDLRWCSICQVMSDFSKSEYGTCQCS